MAEIRKTEFLEAGKAENAILPYSSLKRGNFQQLSILKVENFNDCVCVTLSRGTDDVPNNIRV